MVFSTPEQTDDLRKRGLRPQVVGCAINKDKKLLLLFNRGHNLWQLPQGGVKTQESVKQALMREMEEELGREFVSRCLIPKDFVVESDQIRFPPETAGSRSIMTDKGERVALKGKAYLFCLLNLEGDNHLDIKETEFDDYLWASHEQAESFAKKIYQRGKRRITLRILGVLKEKNLIK